MSESLVAHVTSLCDDVCGRLGPGPAHDRVAEAKARLHEPLRVAIAGNVNAGKSTLLNALLGERIAPTQQGECTQVVTWFRSGFPQGAEIVFRDRTRAPQPLPLGADGALPRTLGVDTDSVERITVRRSNVLLEKMILIDTPGLGSANVHISERTEQMLGQRSLAAAGRADALIYVMTQVGRDGDEAAIKAFRAQFPERTGSAVNAVGVLNKADKGSGQLAARLQDAERKARDLAGKLGALVTDVVPMVGLLAETAERLDEEDAGWLRALAALDDDDRERALEGFEDFMASDVPVPEKRRQRLWDMLDAFGLERCLEWIDGGCRGAGSLRAKLRETSGIDALSAMIHDTFDHRSGALRVGATISQLEAVAYTPDPAHAATLTWLRGALDDLRLEPAWHELTQIRAMRDAAALEGKLPADYHAELRRLVMGRTLPERLGLGRDASAESCAEVALAGAARWRRASADWAEDTPELARIGRVAQRSYTLLLEQARRAR